MREIQYLHQNLRPLVSVVSGAVYRWIVGRLNVPLRAGRRLLPWRRLVIVVAVIITLVAEAVMLYWLAQLVDLCISLMEVWAELAAKHLEITLDRSS
jgi:hypothetical protein